MVIARFKIGLGRFVDDAAVRRTVEWFRHRSDEEDAWRLLPERGHVTHS